MSGKVMKMTKIGAIAYCYTSIFADSENIFHIQSPTYIAFFNFNYFKAS